jgi:glutaredoxin-like protein
MAVLDSRTGEQVKQHLASLAAPVRLVTFTRELECELCAETTALVEEVAATSDLVTAEIHDFVVDKEKADSLGIDKVPAIAVIGAEDYGIRFYGIPSGYEFGSFLAAIQAVASGTVELEKDTTAFLESLTEPLHMQVFVTPACPYCASAVVLAHRMGVASSLVTADMVEATEFRELALKYQVMGVPRTVINDTVHIEGAAPEAMLVDRMRQAAEAAAQA